MTLLLIASMLVLVVVGAWALILYRRTRSTFGALALLGAVLLVGSDLILVSLETPGPDPATSVLLVFLLAGCLAVQVLVVRRLVISWVGPVVDAALIGLAVVLTCWALVTVPAGAGRDAGVFHLVGLATATLLLVGFARMSQLPAGTRSHLVMAAAFPVLHLAGVAVLWARSWELTDLSPDVAVLLLCAAYVALGLTLRTSRRAPARRADAPTPTTRLLPYVCVLAAMVVSLGAAIWRDDDAGSPAAFLALCLVLTTGLCIRQLLTSEVDAARVDAARVDAARVDAALVAPVAEHEPSSSSLAERLASPMLVADLDGRLEHVSAAAELMLGVHGHPLVGNPAADVLGVTQEDLAAAITAAGESGQPQRLDSRSKTGRGHRGLESVLSARGRTVEVNVRQMTDRARVPERRAEEAFHDPLTGLYNRVGALRALEATMESRRRTGGAGPALLFLDLDGFKGVNDVAGHAAGNEVLRLVAARLAEITTDDTLLARLGGDEFAVVLPSASPEQALEEAQRIADVVSQSYEVEEGSFAIGVSIGVAHGADEREPEDLLRNADLAMYAAKRTRRAARAFEPFMHSAAVLRADTDVVHAAALDDSRTELHYQPIVTLDNELPVGVEALLKWRTEDGALGDSGALLEYAERSGRMGTLSGWVIGTALDQVADWREKLGLIPVSVNLAPVDLLRRGLVRALREEIARRDLPASVLTIEITEQVLMQNPDRAIRVITDLRSFGIRVSIDDFGTGFSSLAYLVDLPVDALKIDSSFIQAMPRTKTARVIVSGIIDMARELGLVVVAEGIETVEQRELLLALGNPLCQGYLFSPPLPATEAAALITAARQAQPAPAAMPSPEPV